MPPRRFAAEDPAIERVVGVLRDNKVVRADDSQAVHRIIGVGPDAIRQEIAVGIVGERTRIVVRDSGVFVEFIRRELRPRAAEAVGGEIADEVDQNQKAYYFQQAQNGLYARQAVICDLLGV